MELEETDRPWEVAFRELPRDSSEKLGGRCFRDRTRRSCSELVTMGRWGKGTRGRRHDGVTWEVLKDGVKKGLGPRVDEKAFAV